MTGMTTESSARKQGVVAVLGNSLSQLLFIRRGLKIQRAPGFWCFVGGEVEAGETHEAAIVREVLEEVGLDVAVLEKIHETLSPNGEFALHWMRVSLLTEGQNQRLHPIEVAEARWLSAGEALKLEPLLPSLKSWLEATS